MNKCLKEKTFKYTSRNSPPYSANKCLNLTKKGNDGLLYKSVPNKKGVYRWIKINKNLKNNYKLSLKDLKKMAKRYKITTSGSKKQISQRLIKLRNKSLKKTDKNKLIKII